MAPNSSEPVLGNLYLQTLTTLTHRQASTEQIQIQFSDQKLTNTAPLVLADLHALVLQRPCFLTIMEKLEETNQNGQFKIKCLYLSSDILKTNMICGIFMTKDRIVEMNIARVFKRKYLSNRLIRREKNPHTQTQKAKEGELWNRNSVICRRSLFIRLTRQFWKRIVGQI